VRIHGWPGVSITQRVRQLWGDTMSDVSREEFERLKARVAELEDRGRTRTQNTEGLDHRDEAVLTHMEEHGVVSKLALVRLYKRITDISKTKVAKRRARNLENNPAYAEVKNDA